MKIWTSLKKFGWRIAGLVFWIQAIGWIFGFSSITDLGQAAFFAWLSTILSEIGGSPVNRSLLPSIFKAAWIAFICEFRPLYIIGFFLYIAIFPISFLGFIGLRIFKFFKRSELIGNPSESDDKEKPKRRRLPILTGSGFCLICWLLAFGDAASVAISIIGAFFAGVFFVTLTFRVFMRTTPSTDTSPAFFWWMEVPINGIKSWLKTSQKKSYVNTKDTSEDISILAFFRKVLIRLAKIFARTEARDKAALFVFVDFIATLIFLGLIATIFWALVIKSTDPSNLDLLSCLHISVSSLLPGLDAPSVSENVPILIRISISITAFVLFVLYLGPAGNLIPEKQRQYLSRFDKLVVDYRFISQEVKQEIRTLENLQKRLPAANTVDTKENNE